jgi:MATE family multidrug resistance protein
MQSYRTHLKNTLKLAYPVTIGQLGHVMLGVVDSMMVGRVGAVPLAASSLVNGLVFLVMVFGLGMSLAITPLVAISRGRNDHEQCGVILRQALLVNVVISIILTLLILFLSDLIFYLNQPPEVALQASSYARILGYSIIPFMLFQSYRQFIEGLSFTRPAMYVTVLANLVNAFGNWILIYGNLGAPAMGLDGAGYSTLITRIFMALCIMGYVLWSIKFKIYDPSFRFRGISRKVIRRILSIGFPTGVQHFFEVGAFAFSAVIIGWLGSKPLAAHQIALSMASITFMSVLGVSAAGTIRVGNALGKRDIHEVRAAGLTAILLAAGVMACFAISFIIFRHFLPTLYIENSEVVSIAASLLVIAAFFQMSDGVQAVGLGILRGITDVKIPMIISFVAYWVVGFPIGYLLGFSGGMGVIGVWIGLLIGLTIAAVFFTLRFFVKIKEMLSLETGKNSYSRNE